MECKIQFKNNENLYLFDINEVVVVVVVIVVVVIVVVVVVVHDYVNIA